MRRGETLFEGTAPKLSSDLGAVKLQTLPSTQRITAIINIAFTAKALERSLSSAARQDGRRRETEAQVALSPQTPRAWGTN